MRLTAVYAHPQESTTGAVPRLPSPGVPRSAGWEPRCLSSGPPEKPAGGISPSVPRGTGRWGRRRRSPVAVARSLQGHLGAGGTWARGALCSIRFQRFAGAARALRSRSGTKCQELLARCLARRLEDSPENREARVGLLSTQLPVAHTRANALPAARGEQGVPGGKLYACPVALQP